jgi:hypothetical protein
MADELKKENNKTIFSILMAALLLSAGFQLGFDKLGFSCIKVRNAT